MSEKRFIWKCDDENCQIYDTKEEKAYFNVEVVDLLNEYFDKIISLETEVDFLQMENNGLQYVLKNIRQIELKR